MHNADYLSREALERLGFASLGEHVLIHPTCVLVGCGRMRIGSHVRIDPFCVITMSAECVIGDRVHISAHASLLGAGGITIGDYACISHGTRVLSSSDDFSGPSICGPLVPPEWRHVVTAPIQVARHGVLGANSVILPGGGLGSFLKGFQTGFDLDESLATAFPGSGIFGNRHGHRGIHRRQRGFLHGEIVGIQRRLRTRAVPIAINENIINGAIPSRIKRA